ncbi:MAG: hemerythrin domain-containing protein [Burkholderiales bacterium]|nr:hemerythrin domain-containing protein [Burkholderiales bacterium]
MNTTNSTSLLPAAKNAINRIKAEHRALARILGAMQALVARCREPGSKPDYELFEFMLRYIENVPARLHHPKEDQVLFPAIARLPGGGKTLAQELERDHARGEPMLAELRRAFHAFRDGGANALNQLATAVDEFAEFYWWHMRKEEQQLLPFALENLAEEDWQRVDSAFGDNIDPLFGAALTDEYRRLYQHITELTPQPLKSLLEGAAPGPSKHE